MSRIGDGLVHADRRHDARVTRLVKDAPPFFASSCASCRVAVGDFFLVRQDSRTLTRAAVDERIVELELAGADDVERGGGVEGVGEAAQREIRHRRLGHELPLRRHAVRGVDEDLASLRNEHRRLPGAGFRKLGEYLVDERLRQRRFLDRAMDDMPRREVVLVTGMQREERLARVRLVPAVVHERLVAPDDLGDVALHHPRGAFVFGDEQRVGILRGE